MNKILVSGGAGYIGSVLVRILLNQGYYVRVIDNLKFGGETIVDLLNYTNFDFIKGDVRNVEDLYKALENIDFVVHLAAIVGDPACAKEPELATETNYEASKLFYKIANERQVHKFIYASTCSNYGKMMDPSIYLDEKSALTPVSLYAETKVATEEFLLNQNRHNICKPTCLRFSTVYGLSPRIRFDLTVNEFTKELALGRELLVFGEQFWRPYCHVVDLAQSIVKVINAKENLVSFEVYNVGDTSENYQKKMIIDEIGKQIIGIKVKYIQKLEDPRDYKVSFEKIRSKLDFKIMMRVPDGIRQLIKVIKNDFLTNPDDPKYRNSLL